MEKKVNIGQVETPLISSGHRFWCRLVQVCQGLVVGWLQLIIIRSQLVKINSNLLIKGTCYYMGV